MFGLIRRALGAIKYNVYASRLFRTIALPINRMCEFVSAKIRRRVWINSGQVNYDQLRLTFPRNVGVLYASSIYWNGTAGFEEYTWKVLRIFLGNADVFIDVGSNIGFYAVLSRLVKPSIQVLAFEPVPSIFKKNILFHQANKLEHAGVFNLALGDSVGEQTIFLPVADYFYEEETTATLRKDSWQAENRNTPLKIQMTTLDAVMADKFDKKKCLIKVDVEDFEYSVFLGAIGTLKLLRPVIVCELLPRHHGNYETIELLQELNYEFFAITESGLFRFQKEDFMSSRSFTDFLALPDRKQSWRNYISYSDLPNVAVLY